MGAGNNRTRAAMVRDHDLVPNQYVDVAVTAAAAKIDLAALPYAEAHVTYRFTGVDTTAIPQGTVVVINGRDFATDDASAISGTTVDVEMTAAALGRVESEDLYAGQAGALDAPIADIDNAGVVVSVDDPGSTLDASGKRVHMVAIGGAVTVLRGDHVATLANSAGLIVGTAANPLQSFYVDDGADVDNELTHIAGGSVTLRVMFSDDLS